jgi:hypothetical protein
MMAKSADRKPRKPLAAVADRSAKSSADVTEHDIACYAYALHVARGFEHGHDVDDWLQAERELRSARPPRTV